MPFYLSEYAGSGTRQDSFRPVGFDQPGWSAIDLRPDPSRLDGGGLNACLLHVPSAFTDARATLLADDKLQALTNPQKNFLQNRLGVDLSSPTLLRDIVATILTAPPANGWKPLRPGRLTWEINLGGLLWQVPRASGGATDDFNRADGPLTSPWVQNAGSVEIGLNRITAGSDSLAHYSGAAATADHYSQTVMTNPSSLIGGPAVRIPATTQTCYAYDCFALGGETVKFVNGTYTNLGGINGIASNPVRIEAEGSNISIYFNGVLDGNSPITDTSNTTGQPGIFAYNPGQDDWEGGDLAGQTPPYANVTIR